MSADEEDVTLTEKDLSALKNDVLKENIEEISAQLGDPGRYFASFKAKEILDRSDCETIKAQVTSIDKANVFIDTISGRRGRKGEHPYDVFVGALKRMKVHIHIVRILNQALAKKIAELKTMKRVQNTDVNDGGPPVPAVSGNNNDPITNGFPTNGSSVISRGAGLGPVNIMNAPVTTSSPTSSSSSTSSSSVYPRTPSSSHVTTPTDHTSSPYPTSHVVMASGLPRLPVGTQEEPRSEYSTSSQWEESSIQATPSTTDVDTEVGPIPSLPVGFNSDGSRDNVDDVSALLSNTPDKGYHPVIGPLPPQPPPSMGSQNGLASQSSIDQNILKLLQERVGALEKNKLMMEERNMSLEREVFNARKNFVHLQEQLKHIVIERDVLANERDKMSAIIRHLESQLSILRQSGGGREKTTPSGRLLSPNLHATTAQPRLENRRLTDPYFKDLNTPKHPPQHRPSDPNLRYISHHTATRPNNLPLGIAPGSTHYPPSISYQDTPLPLDVRVPPTSRMFRQSPGSDSSADGLTPNYFKVSASADDLTSGGEDRNSIHSFGSNHSGGGGVGGAKINFELSAAANTQSTVV